MLLKETFPEMKILTPNHQGRHWGKVYSCNTKNKKRIVTWWKEAQIKVKPPCTVSLIRIASRKYDRDNIVTAFKGIQDTISSLLVPGLAPGQADNEKHGIIWVYSQEKGAPKEYAVRIEIS
jgi:hypothetical protein